MLVFIILKTVVLTEQNVIKYGPSRLLQLPCSRSWVFPTEFAQEPEQPRSDAEDDAEPSFAYVQSLLTPHQLLLPGAETQTSEQISPLNEQLYHQTSRQPHLLSSSVHKPNNPWIQILMSGFCLSSPEKALGSLPGKGGSVHYLLPMPGFFWK